MELSTGKEVTVEPIKIESKHYLRTIMIEIALNKKTVSTEISADDLANHFIDIYNEVIFAQGEIFSFEYRGFKYRGEVKSLELVEEGGSNFGLTMKNTDITFTKKEREMIKLKQSAKRSASPLPS